MDDTITTIYCLCDDFLKAMRHRDDPQVLNVHRRSDDRAPGGRSRLYPLDKHGETFRGYLCSKRRYFYGLRVHLVVSGRGEPGSFLWRQVRKPT